MDCGIYLMKGIDHLAQDIEPSFSKNDINYYRNNIVYELYRGLKFNYEDEL